MAIDSKRIAKNTLFLYARLLIVMGVTLYTSRVVLDKLGVDDYGLYNVVYGIIGMLSFLNGTLSSGTSRFITFDLGRGDIEILKRTFSTALFTHVLLAGIIILVGETIGLWYATHVMVVPPERRTAALIVYQISILVTVITISRVPFTSEIMAHEEMNIYAYIGIYEAVAKLLIVYLLSISDFDKLILYAALVALVTLSVFIFYAVFTSRRFQEVNFKLSFDKNTFKSILGFSGWNILANISNTLMGQGVIMLFNLFFAPVVVAAQALANQVSQAMMQFVNNVRQAVNPQVIKLYAEGKYQESKMLTLQSVEYVFDLLLLLGVPCIMILPTLLDIWLVEVPQYAIEFTRLIIIQDILGNFSAAFYTPMVAANKIQKNSIVAVFLCIIQFGLLYIFFKMGFGPIWARYLGIIFCIIWSFVVKPYILWKDIDYKWGEMFVCIGRCIRTLSIVVALCYAIYVFIPQTNIYYSLLEAVLAVVVISGVSIAFMEKSVRLKLKNYILSKL